jgi:hypothetical protein
MSKYNKLYFLHIPKTGGRFFTKYILDPISDTLKESSIEVIKPPANALKHGGWHNDIDENTYIISVFRDPVEFFVSAVAHMAGEQAGIIDQDKDYISKEGSSVLDIDKSFLFNRLKELPYMKDFQSQNFFLSPQEIPLITEVRRHHNQNKTINYDTIKERINRVNLLIRHSDLRSMDYSLLLKKISEDLGISIEIDLSSADRKHYKNNSSEVLFNKLDSKDKEKIYDNFLFDKEIYENDSLFWKEK